MSKISLNGGVCTDCACRVGSHCGSDYIDGKVCCWRPHGCLLVWNREDDDEITT